MRSLGFTVVFLLLVAAGAFGQPAITVVGNAASFLRPALPNGGVAQGGIIAVIGVDIGPADLVQVGAFPLPTELGGASVEITIGGTNVAAYMLYALSTQIAAIVPSNTPVGDGTITVRFNGQTSDPFPIRVVAHAFGIFAINQGGSGPGIFTDLNYVVNTLFFSAGPSQTWMIWGTGLGAVAGNDGDGPLPGDLENLDVKVYVGGVEAQVVYRGRSGCCAGLDQVFFVIPPGVTGCYVPVVLVVNGVPSNTVTISISQDGMVCSDAEGLTRAELEAAQAAGELRAGAILLNRVDQRIPVPAPLPPVQLRTDTATAWFSRYNMSELIAAQNIAGISTPGACRVYQYLGVNPVRADPVMPDALSAGDEITVAGPVGDRMLEPIADGSYFARLGGGQGQAIPGLPGDAGPDYLEPGDYTAGNGNGGAGVGPFQGAFTVRAPVVWTNEDQTASVDRGTGYEVTWTGGDPAAEWVVITGSSSSVASNVGAGFICPVRADAFRFTIPVYVLGALPPTEDQEGTPTGSLAVGAISKPVSLDAEGLDRLRLVITVVNSRAVEFQ